jgi:hypothetical protein
MECKQWEEKGLLFTADELDETQVTLFNDHLQVCEGCREELARYRREKKEFLFPAMFEDEPSPAVDAEIIRVCSLPIRPALVSSVFPSFIKNSLAALFILTVGFGSGAYFAGVKIESGIKLAKQNAVTMQKNALVERQEVIKNDSAARSDSLPKVVKRGNLDVKGVIPVDLTDE